MSTDIQRKAARDYYYAHKEEILVQRRKFYESNKEMCRARVSQRHKRDRATEPEKVAAKRKGYRQKMRDDLGPKGYWLYQAKSAARQRAKKKGYAFSADCLAEKDLPDTCPALGMSLSYTNTRIKRNSPSLDRIVPSLGYVKGNVVCVSSKANAMKQDATLAEMHNLLAFYSTLLK